MTSDALPQVKVCGLTNQADVTLAVGLGAEACGFVAVPASPRYVEASIVAEACQEVPPMVRRVGVFVDESPEAVLAYCAEAGLDTAQLCGSECPEAFRGFPLPIWRRLGVDEGELSQGSAWSPLAELFVLDHPSSPGGSGLPVNWALAARFAEAFPCLLAGGLDGENVAQAIRTVRPIGVDASSRLEERPGMKHSERLQEFVTRALAAFVASKDV